MEAWTYKVVELHRSTRVVTGWMMPDDRLGIESYESIDDAVNAMARAGWELHSLVPSQWSSTGHTGAGTLVATQNIVNSVTGYVATFRKVR